MENWRSYLKEIDVTDPDTSRVITSPDPDLGNVKVSKEDFENLRTVIGLFDPTGISAYPDIPPAIDEFNKYRNIFAAANLAVALAAAIPLLGKVGTALKAAIKLKKTSKSLKSSKALVAAPKNQETEKIFYYVDQIEKIADVVEGEAKKAIKTSAAKIKNRKVSTLQSNPRSGRAPQASDTELSSFPKMDVPSYDARSKRIPRQSVPQMGLLDQAGESSEWMTKAAVEKLPISAQKKFKDAQAFVRKTRYDNRPDQVGFMDTVDFVPDEIPKAPPEIPYPIGRSAPRRRKKKK